MTASGDALPSVDYDATPRLTLEGSLDLGAAAPLRAALLGHRGLDLAVDASDVVHLGALCAQVLVAAAAAWSSDGRVLRFAEASAPFARGAELLGLRHVLTPWATPVPSTIPTPGSDKR